MRAATIVAVDLTAEWRSLLTRHARTVTALDEALDAYGLGMSEFEVLDRLACDCAERPRMQDLAPLLHLSQSALSRLVGRLEADRERRAVAQRGERRVEPAVGQQRRVDAARELAELLEALAELLARLVQDGGRVVRRGGDPRAGEALYRLNRVGRWGGGAHHLSKRAFTLLHARYPGTVWAKRSPYYYD